MHGANRTRTAAPYSLLCGVLNTQGLRRHMGGGQVAAHPCPCAPVHDGQRMCRTCRRWGALELHNLFVFLPVQGYSLQSMSANVPSSFDTFLVLWGSILRPHKSLRLVRYRYTAGYRAFTSFQTTGSRTSTVSSAHTLPTHRCCNRSSVLQGRQGGCGASRYADHVERAAGQARVILCARVPASSFRCLPLHSRLHQTSRPPLWEVLAQATG